MSTSLHQQQAIRWPTRPPRLRFNPDAPAVLQTGSWQCSAASTAWVLRSLGLDHSQDDVVKLLKAMSPPAISEARGLSSGDGSDLAALLSSLGLKAHNSWISFDEALAIAGTRPMAMGGVNFYHWVGVRGRSGDTLLLANPDQTGYDGVGNSLSRAQFAQLGAFAGVWVDV